MISIWIPESFTDRPFARQHFAAITRWASQHHPFYRRRIPEPDKRVPILTREEILAANEELLNGHPETARTSGSTGVPVRVSHSREVELLKQKASDAFVRGLGGPLPRTRIVHPDTNDLAPDLVDIRAPLDEQIARIFQRYELEGGVAITTYPTNAEALCHRIAERGLDMGFIKRFGCYAEAFDPYQRELIRKTFPNAQIWTTYSSMEFGMIATLCPHEPDFYHVCADRIGLELLDADGNPCPDGEVGRIVLTDYFNQNSPLIRYEIGDLGVRGNCPCGRIHLPALRQVIGKVRGSLLHRNGQRVLFADLSVALRDIPGMGRYQVEQETLERFTVRVVCKPGQRANPEFEGAIHAAFVRHFGYSPEMVEVSYVEEIARGANGKFYASLCRC